MPTASLMTHSEYFFRCLNGPWLEVCTAEIVLDFDAGIWSIFQHWLSTGVATPWPCIQAAPLRPGSNNTISSNSETRETWKEYNGYPRLSADQNMASINHLLNTWILADYLLSPTFQNALLDELSCAYEAFYYTSQPRALPPLSHLQNICDHTTHRGQDAPLRRMVGDLVLYGISRGLLVRDEELRGWMERNGVLGWGWLEEGIMGSGCWPAPWNRWRGYYHLRG